MRFLPLPPAAAGRRAWGLVLAHRHLAKAIAWRLVRRRPQLRPHLEDLQQEALIGIYRGALSYSSSRGASFETWAWWWSRAYCQRAGRKLLHPPGASRAEAASCQHILLDEFQAAAATAADQELVAEAHLLAVKLQRHLERRRALPRGPSRAVAESPRRDVQVFLRRLLLDESLQSIGATLGGLTRERVRQLEAAVSPHFDDFTAELRAANG